MGGAKDENRKERQKVKGNAQKGYSTTGKEEKANKHEEEEKWQKLD